MLIARQPVFDTEKQAIHAYELLARNSGLSRFSPPTSDYHSWFDIDKAVLDLADQLLKGELNLLVNVSEHTLAVERRFHQWRTLILKLARKHKILVEVTELVTPSTLQKRWDSLRSMGVELVMDDFGTKYSTLTRLHDFEWDIVKFECGQTNGYTSCMLEGIDACMRKGIPIIAERIETYNQAVSSQMLGFNLQQGYFWAKPEIVLHSQLHTRV